MTIKITSYKITKYNNITVVSLNNDFLYIIMDSPNSEIVDRPPLENV